MYRAYPLVANRLRKAFVGLLINVLKFNIYFLERELLTAQQLLSEQLDLLDAKMREIVEDFHRDDAQQLLVHGRFLEKKFCKSDAWLGEEG